MTTIDGTNWPVREGMVGRHVLQQRQHMICAIFESGLTRMLVFDASNGHWLDPADDLNEVGYLDRVEINGTDQKLHSIKIWK